MAKKHWVMAVMAMGGAGVGVVALCMGTCFGVPCVSTGVSHGLWLDTCPAGEPRISASVAASGWVRGQTGRVSVDVEALYVLPQDSADATRTTWLRRGFSTTPSLVDVDGETVDGVVWERERRGRWKVTLPDLPDGDYTLEVDVDAGFDRRTVRADVPLYTPAITFLQTDRSLYQPGQQVLLRGVLLQRTSLEPIDDRPAQWRVRSPSGVELLVEDDRAGSFGILDTSFPLDRYAEQGEWTATLVSGDSTDSVTFDVRPFKLPRVTADLSPDAQWYGIGDTVRVRGRATYTSGAPIANAPVTLQLTQSEGRWPMPLAWGESFRTRTDGQGRYSIDIGEVPSDLIEHNALRAVARVTEAAGEVATGVGVVRISADDLKVQALTELGGGLVDGVNNRVWLRVTTPDGRPQPGATVSVDNPWDEDDTPRLATADADGVATVQIDPGPAVSVRIPAPPVRVAEVQAEPVTVRDARVVGGLSASLDDRRALESALPALEACRDVPGTAEVGVRVLPTGRVGAVVAQTDLTSACVATAMRDVRFPSGAMRTLQVTWDVPTSLRPSLTVSTNTALRSGGVSGVSDAYERASKLARSCIPVGAGRAGRVFDASWSVGTDDTVVSLDSVERRSDAALPPSVIQCITRAFTRVPLANKAGRDGLGSVSVTLVPSPRTRVPEPQPTIRTGYELRVAAHADDEPIGDTRVILTPGTVPPLRLRATPALAAPGDTLTVEMLRGPGFRGTLPKTLVLKQGTVVVAESPVDEDTRSASFELPSDLDGFVYVDVSGARTVAFVSDSDPLSVAVTADQDTYRPGQTATLTVRTRAGGRGVPAGVGLSGVDESLGQLGPLLAPDAMSRVTVRAESNSPAFGTFGAAALAMGQIRGEQAAQAALMTVSQLPMDAAGDRSVGASGHAEPNTTEALIEPFFRARGALIERVAEWEDTAPEDEVLVPADVVTHWRAVLSEEARAGRPVVDLYGRELTLARLPADLLRQLDPKELVNDATRLPEDVIDWERWISQEVR